MTQRPNTGTMQKNLKLTIGADTYEKHVSSIAWTPSTNVVTWQGGTPDALLTDQSIATWVAAWTVLQDHQNPDSLYNWMIDHVGQKVVVEYMPEATGITKYTATVTIPDPSVGGAVNAFNEAQISAGSTKPVRTYSTPAAAAAIVSTDVITGPPAGGNAVQIYGSGFGNVTAVKFGTADATNFTKVSSTLIVATAPAQAAGSKPVKVVNPSGDSNTSPYTYA